MTDFGRLPNKSASFGKGVEQLNGQKTSATTGRIHGSSRSADGLVGKIQSDLEKSGSFQSKIKREVDASP